MLDLLGKLFNFALETALNLEVSFNNIVRNIVLWIAYYFRGYEARVAAVFGGLLIVLTLLFLNLLSSITDSWRNFVEGEVARSPGRVRSGFFWLWMFARTTFVNGFLLYVIGHFIWNIIVALRYLPIY